jgi:GntR family transcriptional regulator
MSITDLKFNIDRDSTTPLWLQIRNELFNCLYRDVLRPGQLIPNEKTLVELFNVSIGTIRKAVGVLEKEGFFIRKQGLGTFVFQHDNSSFLFEYFHFALNGSDEKQIPTVEFISFDTKKATKDEAAELGISPRSPVFQILNKIGLNKKFYIVDRIVIDQNKFPGLTEDIFKNRSNTIYNLYQNKYNIFITNCSEKLKAITADEKIAKLLNIPLHEPILKINRIGQTYHNETIELRTSYVHTSDIEYIHSQNSTFGEAI